MATQQYWFDRYWFGASAPTNNYWDAGYWPGETINDVPESTGPYPPVITGRTRRREEWT